jgi:hypothetical protein
MKERFEPAEKNHLKGTTDLQQQFFSLEIFQKRIRFKMSPFSFCQKFFYRFFLLLRALLLL